VLKRAAPFLGFAGCELLAKGEKNKFSFNPDGVLHFHVRFKSAVLNLNQWGLKKLEPASQIK
jgi:hypothetical protein